MPKPFFLKKRVEPAVISMTGRITHLLRTNTQPIATFLLKDGRKQVMPLNNAFLRTERGNTRKSSDIVEDINAICHDMGAIKVVL